ncbi:hypothetical protein KJ965_05425 [Patescibacteria group bacterium]|nr:hypothetical protein [Patescibacteria group bacterium]
MKSPSALFQVVPALPKIGAALPNEGTAEMKIIPIASTIIFFIFLSLFSSSGKGCVQGFKITGVSRLLLFITSFLPKRIIAYNKMGKDSEVK